MERSGERSPPRGGEPTPPYGGEREDIYEGIAHVLYKPEEIPLYVITKFVYLSKECKHLRDRAKKLKDGRLAFDKEDALYIEYLIRDYVSNRREEEDEKESEKDYASELPPLEKNDFYIFKQIGVDRSNCLNK